jgi:hypothetical protein
MLFSTVFDYDFPARNLDFHRLPHPHRELNDDEIYLEGTGLMKNGI